MSIEWPARFPAPTIQGYGVEPGEAIARTKMDGGLARQRRRFTSAPTDVKVRWIFDDATFGLFEAWYRHKAKEGAEWVLIDLKSGSGFNKEESRFTKPYKAKMMSDRHWEVNASLEVRDMSRLNEITLDIILTLDIDVRDFLLYSDKLKAHIHDRRPGPQIW